jgi:hypothetical protein
MFSSLLTLLGLGTTNTKKDKEPQTTIPVGSTWILNIRSNDPFPPKQNRSVTVLEVKEGWVRYSMGSIFKDERMDSSTFLAIYSQAQR